jgi:hypothetical protein
VQVACTINYDRKVLWKKQQKCDSVDYRRAVGENNQGCRGIVGSVSQISFASGPVAQLGARFHGMEEVVGSIPTRSTNHSLSP